ncbi:MAG: glycosyltransferase family 4 protein [Ferruginibacter sp.]|nr:glycosyltransferase family 4 protein [Ferruginibacter sp.]
MYYIIFLAALGLLINGYFRVADYFNIIDKPNSRSSHTEITIRGGGIIFSLGAIAYFISSGFQFPYFISGLLLISTISFMDDIKTVSRSTRLIVHFNAVLLLFYQLELFSFPWWTWLFALIITIGIINAYNFMDGINGITGGYSLAVLTGLWLANNYTFAFIDNKFLYCVAIALMVFNWYNFRLKARCFAGDVGSVSIAFILIFLLGKLILGSENIIYLFFLTLYGVDSVLTIVHRILLKENIFEAHRKHLFQVLANEAGISHQLISIGYTVVQVLINTMIVALIGTLSLQYMALIIALLLIICTIIYVVVKKKYYKLPGIKSSESNLV